MPQEKKIRSDQEWLELIRECRASGLPDREWCQIHSISINTFYNKVSDLRKKACEIPKTQAATSRQKHEVVPLELAGSPAPCLGKVLGMDRNTKAAWRQQAGKSCQLRDKPQRNAAELYVGRQMRIVKQCSGAACKILCHWEKKFPVPCIRCGRQSKCACLQHDRNCKGQ